MRSFYLVLALVFICSCQTYEVEHPEVDALLNVNCILSTGSKVHLSLTRNSTSYYGEPSVIDDAFVRLFKNGDLFDTLNYDPAADEYVSSTLVDSSAASYNIEVETTDGAFLSASSYLPDVPQVRLTGTDTSGTTQSGDPVYRSYFEIRSADPLYAPMYVKAMAYRKDTAVGFHRRTAFSDSFLPGGLLVLDGESNNLTVGALEPVFFKFVFLSEELFKYIEYASKFEEGREFAVTTPAVTPGNINGGTGIFGWQHPVSVFE